jgi:hypothetical protein
LRIIWMAFLASVGLYVAAFFAVSMAGPAANPPVLAVLRPLFWSLAAAIGVASLWWRRRCLARSASPIAPVPGGDTLPASLGRAGTDCVMAWAMSEAVAVLGLVLGLLSHEVDDFLPMAFAAIVLLYLHRPSAWQAPGQEVFS